MLRIFLVTFIVTFSLEAIVLTQDRIYVDQYMPLRSELMIAETDGSNPRKLLPGLEIDYNVSFSPTAERSYSHPSGAVRRIFFGRGWTGRQWNNLPIHQPLTIRRHCHRIIVPWPLSRVGEMAPRISTSWTSTVAGSVI